MRFIWALTTVAILSGCSIDAVTDSVLTAQPYVGLEERYNRSEIKNLVGVDPVRTEWCAAFVNAILEKDGIPGSDSVTNNPLLARGFLEWGQPVDRLDIQRGDVVIFPRGTQGWQGHVGFYVETQIIDGVEYWVILGGNQDNSVRYDLYRPNRAIGIRRWLVQTPQQQVQFLVLSNLLVDDT